ncbi:hypothetical protein H257_01821 [Aphanomyces astaci]|uniref:Uncharacterized protein n=1 Tax=Aphanomyces astaci TaxID=112090 RepID=W4H4A5_APHAT|nr:hypothetical protein H257_01821 [Aphanomyces astaci]ETV86722.1 hypothetical protein H257_01821 [Aphanomyces astaci]|eukprot:XP_009823521.1 hypothetical protein H257_01821 [Aphanomyces astaci]
MADKNVLEERTREGPPRTFHTSTWIPYKDNVSHLGYVVHAVDQEIYTNPHLFNDPVPLLESGYRLFRSPVRQQYRTNRSKSLPAIKSSILHHTFGRVNIHLQLEGNFHPQRGDGLQCDNAATNLDTSRQIRRSPGQSRGKFNVPPDGSRQLVQAVSYLTTDKLSCPETYRTQARLHHGYMSELFKSHELSYWMDMHLLQANSYSQAIQPQSPLNEFVPTTYFNQIVHSSNYNKAVNWQLSTTPSRGFHGGHSKSVKVLERTSSQPKTFAEAVSADRSPSKPEDISAHLMDGGGRPSKRRPRNYRKKQRKMRNKIDEAESNPASHDSTLSLDDSVLHQCDNSAASLDMTASPLMDQHSKAETIATVTELSSFKKYRRRGNPRPRQATHGREVHGAHFDNTTVLPNAA